MSSHPAQSTPECISRAQTTTKACDEGSAVTRRPSHDSWTCTRLSSRGPAVPAGDVTGSSLPLCIERRQSQWLCGYITLTSVSSAHLVYDLGGGFLGARQCVEGQVGGREAAGAPARRLAAAQKLHVLLVCAAQVAAVLPKFHACLSETTDRLSRLLCWKSQL